MSSGPEFHYRRAEVPELLYYADQCARQAKRAARQGRLDDAMTFHDRALQLLAEAEHGEGWVLVQLDAGHWSIGLAPDPAKWPDGLRYQCPEACRCRDLRRSIRPTQGVLTAGDIARLAGIKAAM